MLNNEWGWKQSLSSMQTLDKKEIIYYFELRYKIIIITRIGCLKNGIDEIKCHPWFSNVKWDNVSRKCEVPPIKPKRLVSALLIFFTLNGKLTLLQPCVCTRNSFSEWSQLHHRYSLSIYMYIYAYSFVPFCFTLIWRIFWKSLVSSSHWSLFGIF